MTSRSRRTRASGALAAVCIALGIAPAGHASAASQNGTKATPFAALAQRYVAEAERRDPLFADSLGVRRFDDDLPDFATRARAERRDWLRGWRTRLQRAIDDGLRPNDDADAHALLDAIDLELFEAARLRPDATDPTVYTTMFGTAVYALTGRRDVSPEARLRHAAPRLRRVPQLVADAEANLDRPARVVTEQAIAENDGNVALYASLPREAAAASPATRRAIASALPAALNALRGFGRYLRGPLLRRSTGSPRVGAEVYDRELLLADGTDETRAEIVAAATADFARNRAEMLRLALPLDRELFPNDVASENRSDAVDVVVRRVLDKLAEDHPQRDAILTTARDDVAGAESFLRAHPVIAVPEPDRLRVVATPEFMAGFSGASLDPAGPFAPQAESFYYIDSIPSDWKPERVASYLRDFNTYELRMLSIHEAMPGHYVQFRANAHVPSLVRRAFANGSFAEGWATYVEGLMLDSGYGDGDPRLRLFQLKWRLREEANVLIDAAFHTGDLTEARCDDLLERQAYQETSEAHTKWHRLQLSHDQLTSYFVGLSAIRKAEADARAERGDAFDAGAFTRDLLAVGSVEPRYLLPLLQARANAASATESEASPAAESSPAAARTTPSAAASATPSAATKSPTPVSPSPAGPAIPKSGRGSPAPRHARA